MALRALIVTLALLVGTGATMANCYEDIGCDDGRYFTRSEMRRLSCSALWEVRNAIYAQNGYCFKTERAINFFGNDQCYIDEQADVRLNTYERANIATIVNAESAKGCR